MNEVSIIKTIYGLDYPPIAQTVINQIEEFTFNTPGIDSLAVAFTDHLILSINKSFFAKVSRRLEHLFMALMHEIYHVLLGHPFLDSGRSPEIDNICFDVMINAELCRRYPEEKYTSYFTSQYSDSRFYSCLLRPIGENTPERFRSLLTKLYTTDQTTYKEIYDCIDKELERQKKGEEAPTTTTSTQPANQAAEAKEVASANDDSQENPVGQKDPTTTPIKGGTGVPSNEDTGNQYRSLALTDGSKVDKINTNAALISQVIESFKNHRRCAERKRLTQTYFYCPQDRHACAKLDLYSHSMPLYEKTISTRNRGRNKPTTLVYLDVSGSNIDFVAHLLPILEVYLKKGQIDLYAFSTKVEKLTLQATFNGNFEAGGGTDINAVFDHIYGSKKYREARNIVLFTDGLFGSLKDNYVKRNQKNQLKIAIVLTPGSGFPPSLGVAYKSITILSK